MKIRFFPLLLLASTTTLGAANLPLVEEFENNARGWVTEKANSKQIETIKEGRFTCENLNPNVGAQDWSSTPVDLEKNQDFEILIRVKVVEGTPTGTHAGIVWDSNATLKRFFEISAHGNYSINYREKDVWVLTRAEIPTKLIRKTEDNELAIRRIGSRVYYLINGVAVDSMEYAGVEGQAVGLETYAGCTNSFDRLVVRYLAGSPEKRAAEARQYEAEARAAYLAAGPAPKAILETFDDNSRIWTSISEGKTWSGKIADGVLEWQNRSTDSYQATQAQLPINDAGNYDLSLRIRHVAGPADKSIGFQWGNTTNDQNRLQMCISGNGLWTFDERIANALNDVVPWRETSLLKSGQFNEVRIRQLGHTLFLFINGQVVGDVPARRLVGEQVELIVSPGMTVAFDDLKLTYAQLTDAQAEAEITKVVADLKRAHGQKGLGAVYSVAHREEIASAQSKADMQRLADAAAEALTDADFKQLTKVRKQFSNKKMISLLGAWGKPVSASADQRRMYYNYKLVGRTQYYYEFEILTRGRQQEWLIEEVQQTSRRW